MVMGTTMGYEPSLKGVFDELYVIHTSRRESSDTIRDRLWLILSIAKGVIVIKGVGYLHLLTVPRY